MSIPSHKLVPVCREFLLPQITFLHVMSHECPVCVHVTSECICPCVHYTFYHLPSSFTPSLPPSLPPQGFTDIVKLILRYGKHQMQELVTARDTEGNTPLHFAAESGKPEIVKCIVICRAADIEARKDDETTPLHIASRHGRLEVVKLIVAYNKKTMAAEDIYQQTPLHFAAKYNHSNVIQFLLEE